MIKMFTQWKKADIINSTEEKKGGVMMAQVTKTMTIGELMFTVEIRLKMLQELLWRLECTVSDVHLHRARLLKKQQWYMGLTVIY